LKRLLVDVERHVPYYKQLFAEVNFIPADFGSLEDLQRIPLLTKSRIRENIERLKADNAKGLSRFNTGGSSGEPLIFFISNERISHDVAAKWRATRWWGVDIGDREIVIWGSPIELGAQDYLRQFRDKLLRTRLFSAFEMSNQQVEKYITEIQAIRPRMLFGYPSSLAHIATYAEQHRINMSGLGVKVAFVTSERLYDYQYSLIERVFSCNVANGYGGRDAGFIAHQCPDGGMHITAEDLVVEILDRNGYPVPKGTSGEIVVTHLATRDFPFIRYRTGDIGVLDTDSCRCGRGLPLLKEIQGRSTDFIVATNGTVLHGLALIYILRDIPIVREFRIIQESIYLIRILVVLVDDIPPSVVKEITNSFQARLGQDVEIILERVGSITAEKSGKYRYVISKVAIPQ